MRIGRHMPGMLAGVVVVVTLSLVFGIRGVQGEELALDSRLKNDGVAVLSAVVDQTGRSAEIVVRSLPGGSPEDPWTRVAIERELLSSRLRAGDDGIAYTVTYVDQAGRIVESMTLWLDPRLLPAPSVEVESRAADEVKAYVEQQTRIRGATVSKVDVTNIGNQGPIVVLELAVTPGSNRDGQIVAAIDMIDGLREKAENGLAIPVQAYKLTILEAGTGRGLVGYVLQPGVESLHTWHASDVTVDFRVVGTPDPSRPPTGD